MGEMQTAESKDKMEADLDKQWVWGGVRCMGWTIWIQKETFRREKWKFGRLWSVVLGLSLDSIGREFGE